MNTIRGEKEDGDSGLGGKDPVRNGSVYGANSEDGNRTLAVWAEDGLLTVAAQELSNV